MSVSNYRPLQGQKIKVFKQVLFIKEKDYNDVLKEASMASLVISYDDNQNYTIVKDRFGYFLFTEKVIPEQLLFKIFSEEPRLSFEDLVVPLGSIKINLLRFTRPSLFI